MRLARASFGYDLRLWRPGTDHRATYSARADLGGGIVLDAIHELDYLLWLLGPVASVTAETAESPDVGMDVEVLALAVLRFRSGALGAVDLNFSSSPRTGAAASSRGRGSRDLGLGAGDGDDPPRDRRGRALHRLARPRDGYREELADFIAAAQLGKAPRTTASRARPRRGSLTH